MKKMTKVKKYGAKVPLIVGGLASSSMALAIPDAAAIATEIEGVSASIDTIGGSIMTVIIGVALFSMIIGFVRSKAK